MTELRPSAPITELRSSKPLLERTFGPKGTLNMAGNTATVQIELSPAAKAELAEFREIVKTINDRMAKVLELHARKADPMKDQPGVFRVHCACDPTHGFAWKEGDPEPDWKCQTRKVLEGIE